jgi:hypothetical protein
MHLIRMHACNAQIVLSCCGFLQAQNHLRAGAISVQATPSARSVSEIRDLSATVELQDGTLLKNLRPFAD